MYARQLSNVLRMSVQPLVKFGKLSGLDINKLCELLEHSKSLQGYSVIGNDKRECFKTCKIG